jgi:hypothetical protein
MVQPTKRVSKFTPESFIRSTAEDWGKIIKTFEKLLKQFPSQKSQITNIKAQLENPDSCLKTL